MRETRTQLGFPRTECACEECVINCHYIPGYLIPSDLEAIGERLGYADLVNFAMENLLASPGATVLVDGQVLQIPTLVPNRRLDGACRFLDPDNRCSIHAVSPYGCAFFDCHQSQREADIRSCRGLQAIAREWSVGGLYARIWMALHAAGFHAPSPTTARARLKEAIETRRSQLDRLYARVVSSLEELLVAVGLKAA